MYSVPAKLKKPTENLNTELTEKLFYNAHAVALDLAAINIQRGREHGIPGYNEYRAKCKLSVAQTFDDLKHEITDADVRAKLKELYGHPNNIDLFVGGILEDQINGGKIGPLFQCILIEQFNRLRHGDRHWYENPSTFEPAKLSQIRMASLGRVLCDNGDNITQITDNVFFLPSTQSGYKSCDDIPKINLNVWLNCDKCSAHQDPNTFYVDPTLPRQSQNGNGNRNGNGNANGSGAPAQARVRRDVDNVDETTGDVELSNAEDTFIKSSDINEFQTILSTLDSIQVSISDLQDRIAQLESQK